MKNNKKYYSFEKISDTIANLYIYGDITSYEWYEDDVSAFGFKKELDELKDVSELNVHINSYGGETFQGLAIYNLLKQHNAKINVYIDGIAASSASLIAMAGDVIYMPKTSLIMIHNCWTYAVGNANELRKTAEDMDKIAVAYKEAYLSKVNINEQKLDELLENESYLTADECIEMGFANKIVDSEENAGINQYANMSIMKLVSKAKECQKQNKENIDKILEKMSETFKQSAEEIANKIFEKNCKGSSKEEPIGIFNNVNQNLIKTDSWESFFNTKN